MESNGETAQPFLSYQSSVHGRAVANGSQTAAVCTDCHGTHGILSANDPRSPISEFSVAKTCGACHADVASTFNVSSRAGAGAGQRDGATCTDCHGIHSIKPHTDPNSPVAEQTSLATSVRAAMRECGFRRSSAAGQPRDSYLTAIRPGCRGRQHRGCQLFQLPWRAQHSALEHPRSTVNSANLDATCGKCHKGVTRKFTQTKVHTESGVQPRDIGSIAVRWVRLIYIVLILVVIGVMFLHNFILWRSKAIARRRMQNPFMQRMTANQRWQHLILLLSFIVLVITGFALKFPDSWFAEVLGMGEKWRGILHRVAGVVLIGAGIYHVFYLAAAREGRRLIRDLAPRPKDAFDALYTMLYSLGLRSEKPQFARFNYAEKAEYWALVWGTALMGVTGVMIWAKVWVGDILARWWVDIATAVHFYEAILATLAIVVWHFYQVFFDPDVYPMNWAWWDGKMPVEHYRHEHPLDKESLGGDESKEQSKQQ